MKYDELLNMKIGSGVIYREYELDRHENKRLELEVRGELSCIIPSGDSLDSNLLATYYPDNSTDEYPMLSYSSDIRLVIQTGVNKMGLPSYKTVNVNSYYYSVSLQTVEILSELVRNQPEIPSQILGFNSYDFGKKFK